MKCRYLLLGLPESSIERLVKGRNLLGLRLIILVASCYHSRILFYYQTYNFNIIFYCHSTYTANSKKVVPQKS